MKDYADAARDRSVVYANDLLRLAADFPDDPRYGTAIVDANTTLALVSLRDNNPDDAVRYVRRAMTAPQSEEMKYGLHGDWFFLSRELMRHDERATALAFVEWLAGFSLADEDALHDAADSLRRGVEPVLKRSR